MTQPITKEVDGVTVIYDTPPVWDSVCRAFGVIPQTAVFTYGESIYNPSGGFMPDHIIVHEKIHIEQQKREGMTAALWWGKFLRDPAFRLDQESEAYAAQYRFVCTKVKDRNARSNFLMNIARTMGGIMYGNMIGIHEASKLIRERSGVPR